jgi:hypothetical protein
VIIDLQQGSALCIGLRGSPGIGWDQLGRNRLELGRIKNLLIVNDCQEMVSSTADSIETAQISPILRDTCLPTGPNQSLVIPLPLCTGLNPAFNLFNYHHIWNYGKR